MSEGDIAKITSLDGETFEVPVAVLSISELCNKMNPDDEMPIGIHANILAKVIEFLKQYAIDPMTAIPKPPRSAKMTENVQEWYANFIDVDDETLYEFIKAADFMHIAPLTDLACGKIVCSMKTKSKEEIMEMFVLDDPFTPEEEEDLRKEHAWCFEETN